MAKGISIHLGLNRVDPRHYAGWDGELAACENDARDMQAIAAQQGYESRLLLTSAATYGAVTEAIRESATALGDGDILLVTYSGHGGQVPDGNGDERDGRDETWVLYDRELVDDELYGLWGQFERGVRIFMLSDSCHSGSVARAALYRELGGLPGAATRSARPPSRFRGMTREQADRTYEANQALYDEVQRTQRAGERVAIGASVILISGCQDNQLSADGDRNGLFTETLLQVWNGGKFRGGYHRFQREIQEAMPPWQSPNYFRVGASDVPFVRRKPFRI